MRQLPIAFAATALLAATACARERPVVTPPAPDECGANLVSRYIGSAASPEVRASIAARVGERPIRYYTAGDPVTMDFNPARLNVELYSNGRIARLRCG